jgi:hypothetical protein
VGESTRAAMAAAEQWLAEEGPDEVAAETTAEKANHNQSENSEKEG